MRTLFTKEAVANVESKQAPVAATPLGTTRICSTCKNNIAVENFYKKRNGHESICKVCKRQKRKGHLALLEGKAEGVDPPRLIEPEKDGSTPDQSDTSYALWERRYGRPLTELEKAEIRRNLTEFFQILIAEDEKIK